MKLRDDIVDELITMEFHYQCTSRPSKRYYKPQESAYISLSMTIEYGRWVYHLSLRRFADETATRDLRLPSQAESTATASWPVLFLIPLGRLSNTPT